MGIKCRFVEKVIKRYIAMYYADSPNCLHFHETEITKGQHDRHEAFDWPEATVKCEKCGENFISKVRSTGPRDIWNTEDGKLHPGDVWFVDYYHGEHKHLYCPWDNCNDPRGHLFVMLPDGHMWNVDGRASNCTMKEDKTHRCWIRHGDPPNLHVDKNGHTCSAGAGSILSPLEGHWHGFLHHGELVSC